MKFKRAYLRNLDSDGMYKMQGSERVYSGSQLMHAGLDLPYVSVTQDAPASPSRIGDEQGLQVLDSGDFVSSLLVLEKV